MILLELFVTIKNVILLNVKYLTQTHSTRMDSVMVNTVRSYFFGYIIFILVSLVSMSYLIYVTKYERY